MSENTYPFWELYKGIQISYDRVLMKKGQDALEQGKELEHLRQMKHQLVALWIRHQGNHVIDVDDPVTSLMVMRIPDKTWDNSDKECWVWWDAKANKLKRAIKMEPNAVFSEFRRHSDTALMLGENF